MKEIQFCFEWCCPSCGKEGYEGSFDGVYAFCPYCGSKDIQISDLERKSVDVKKVVAMMFYLDSKGKKQP